MAKRILKGNKAEIYIEMPTRINNVKSMNSIIENTEKEYIKRKVIINKSSLNNSQLLALNVLKTM